MYTIIASIDGRPDQATATNDRDDADRIADTLRQTEVFDRVDVLPVTWAKELITYAQSEQAETDRALRDDKV